jgi:ribonuclease P protein component
VLNKKNRLPLKNKVNAINTITSSLFTLKIAKNDNKDKRFAIIIGKTVDKRAVHRNGLRRKFSEAIGNILEQILPGFDFLIIVKKQALLREETELREELINILKKEELIG